MGKSSMTASAIAFDFGSIYAEKSRADEVKVLFVMNKPPRKNQRGPRANDKPGGWGCPTGQAESGEAPERTVLREMKAESGYSGSVIGELFTVEKPRISNTIFVYLVEPGDCPGNITECEEIAGMRWMSLREILSAPPAQTKTGERDPEGVYTSHVNRLLDAIYMMLEAPESLTESVKILTWIKKNPREIKALGEAMDEILSDRKFDHWFPEN
jgi:ADP-ribose pyrophosphatase YjhB (NUDIX family)